MTLLEWLSHRYPDSKRTTLRRMLQAGRVSINGKVVRAAKHLVGQNDAVVVSDRIETQPARPSSREKKLPPLDIVFEDEHIVVVNKPPGLLTSTVRREPRPTLLAAVRRHYENERRVRIGLIHRLDRDASGLLIFSKTNAAYESLKTQFFKHTVERVYTAVVHGVPEPRQGRIESRLIELPDGIVQVTRLHGKGQRAVTDYEVIDDKGKQSLLKVTLQTGRKHQIRVHLSRRGWPIVGDPVYGKSTDAGPLRLMATKLSVDHPITGKRHFFELAAKFAIEQTHPK